MGERNRAIQRLRILIFLLLAVYTLGTVGYVLIEGWDWMDAFYMTAITLTTVGFGEVQTLSPIGRLYTIFLIIIGIGGVSYSFVLIGQYVVENSFSSLSRERRMIREIENLKDHYIICGYGRVGQQAAEMIVQSGYNVVVIDLMDDKIENVRVEHEKLHYLIGDATDDAILQLSGLDRASGLLVCTGDDANNLFVVLSARSLRKELLIIARSSHHQNEAKMVRAGANKVISPYHIGGQRMANFALRPGIVEMLDVVTTSSGLELWLEDVTIDPKSPLVGKSIGEAEIRGRTGVNIVVITRGTRNVMAPSADMTIVSGDHMVVVGTRDQVRQLENLAGAPG